jgi:1-acyl-sn-glycerol-3-phosphate acyltransferase
VTEPPELDVAWARSAPARVVREAVLVGVFGPLMKLYTRRTVRGREHLEGLDAPVVFVANHSSHMDTPAILRALPGRWRRRTAVAAAADYFYVKRRLGWTVSLFFGTVPVARDGRGLDHDSTAHIEQLFQQGWSLVMYAEGTRSRDGSVGKLRSGSAVLAAQHGLSLVPIHVSGSHEVMPVGRYWPRFQPGRKRYPVEISFGPPIRPTDAEHRSEVMERVRVHLEHS